MARTRRARPWDAYRRAEAAHVARIEDTPAEDRRLPAWAALVALLPLLGLAAWAVDGVAVPALADLVRSGPALAAALVALVGCATFILDATPILKPTRRIEALYERTAPWLPGETTPERDERLNSGRADAPGSWYPDSGPGRVISVRDVVPGYLSLSHMADKDRPCVILEATDATRAALISRTMRIDPATGMPVQVTIEDRLGATLAPLVAKYGGRAAVEVAEQAADIERREAELAPGIPHEPSSFTLEVERLRKALPPTVTHTGTGLYSAKVTPTHLDRTQSGAPVGQAINLTVGGLGILSAWAGGYVTNATRSETRAIVSHTDTTVTLEGSLANWQAGDDLDIYNAWSAVQAICNQLYTNQGVGVFSTIQELRLYGGTFKENVTLSTGVATNFENFLWVRAATGETPIIDGTAGNCWTNWPVQHSRFDGITFSTGGTAYGLYTNSSQRGRPFEVRRCTFLTAKGIYEANTYYGSAIIDDCIFALTAGAGVRVTASSLLMRRCHLSGGTTHIIHANGHRCEIEDCTFRNAAVGIITSNDYGSALSVKHCNFYGLTTGDIVADWSTADSFSDLVALNNIHEDSAVVYWLPSRCRLSNVNHNCIHNATKVAVINTTDYTTLANWQALADEDGDSPDANSIAADPLLTSPATGDFSLQAASPCKWTGVGAGVTSGINNVAFDGPHPDIGSWSSGPVPAPSWAGGVSNIVATNLAAAGEVGLTWDEAAATVLTNLSKGYVIESRTVAGPGAYVEHGRSITESFTVGGLTDGVAREFRVTAYTRVEAEPFAVASDTDTATPTHPLSPVAPEIEATDLLNQSDVRVDIVADDPADVSTIYYRLVPGGVLQTWGVTVTGDGSQTITGLLVHSYVIFAVAQRAGCNSVPSNLEFLNVQAADQYTATRTALYEWVKGIVGNPIVIWRNANAPQPTRQYVSIHMGPMTVMGRDYHSGADVDGIETVTGDREFVFSIQIHGKPSNEDGSASISMLERLRSSLEKRSIQATLSAAGLGYVAVEGSGDLAGIGGTEFEARTFMDIRFRTSYQDTDDVGYVGTVTAPVGTLE